MSIRGVFLNPGTGIDAGTTLTHTGNFGIADSPTGTLSFWWRSLSPTVFDTTSSGYMNLLFTYPTSPSALFTFMQFAPATPGFETSFCDGTLTNKASPNPGRVWVQDGKWHHLIMSWDTNHAIGSRVYNCAIDRLVTWTATHGSEAGGAFAIPYSAVTKWQINDSNQAGGDIAELWFAPGVQLDVTDTAVLDKFASTGGGPVGLGSDGSTPTGTAPILYLSVQSSTATDFLLNRGSGGGAFVVDAVSEIGLAVSDTDPAFDVPRLITGSRSTLTMRTAAFSGLDVSQAFPSSGFVYFGETSTGLLNGASLAIATIQPQFDSGDLITPVTASFASLHDDAVNYDSAAITPPVAGDGDGIGTFLMAKGTGSVYLWQVDKTTPAVSVDVFPLTTSITTIGPITVPITAWMTDQFTNLAHPQQMASLLWWDGKEQCAGLADSTPASGKVAMVDSAGTITNTKVWGGYTEWQDWICRNGGSAGNVLLTIPDAINNQNYFITVQTTGSLQYNTVYAVTADSTGAELSRAPIYCDDLDVESIIRNSVDFAVSAVDPTAFAATPQGFAYLASDGSTTYLLMLDREATTYTLYTLTADVADTAATTLLSDYFFSSTYVDSSQHWLLLQDGSSTAILWDGSDTPPGVSITGVSATTHVSASAVEINPTISGIVAAVSVGTPTLTFDSNVAIPGIRLVVSTDAPRTLVADLVSPSPAGIDAPLFSQDDFTQAYLDLLPRGRVWPKYPGSNLRDTVAALIGSYARAPASLLGSDASAYGSTHRAVDELLDTMPYWDRLGPNAVTDLLPEWQSTLGLPDDCLGPDPSIAQEVAQCVARFILAGGQSIPFYLRAAVDLGFTITSVTEFVGFRPDIDHTDDELRDEWAVFLWLVTSIDDSSWLFEADVNTGDEALGGFGNTTLQCELLEIAPAHTVPYFAVVPDLPIHGVVAMVEVGTVGTDKTTGISLTGVAATVQLGTVGIRDDSSVSISGVTATVHAGITSTRDAISLIGVEADGQVGAVTI